MHTLDKAIVVNETCSCSSSSDGTGGGTPAEVINPSEPPSGEPKRQKRVDVAAADEATIEMRRKCFVLLAFIPLVAAVAALGAFLAVGTGVGPSGGGDIAAAEGGAPGSLYADSLPSGSPVEESGNGILSTTTSTTSATYVSSTTAYSTSSESTSTSATTTEATHGNLRSTTTSTNAFVQPVLALKHVANDGIPESAYPLQECQGDCDTDDDCMGDLKCFQRVWSEAIPGCLGEGLIGADYCFIRPANYLFITDQFPLGPCNGDCDFDDDCAGDLICEQHDDFEKIPGCDGTGDKGRGYCRDPAGADDAEYGFNFTASLPPSNDDQSSDNFVSEVLGTITTQSTSEGTTTAEMDHGNNLHSTTAPTKAPSTSPTLSPVTASPTTASPVTSSPVTASPTTASPVSASPVTASPVTSSPVSASPITTGPTEAAAPPDIQLATPAAEVPNACIAAGEACPADPADEMLCCVGYCILASTGEKLCGLWESILGIAPPRPPPADACVASGEPCPADKRICCEEGICELDRDTGVTVCGRWVPTEAGPPQPPPEWPDDLCLAAGTLCPDDKKRCCDGKCSKNEATGEKVCGKWTCQASGEVCTDKKHCCSGECVKWDKWIKDNEAKGAETEGLVAMAFVGSELEKVCS